MSDTPHEDRKREHLPHIPVNIPMPPVKACKQTCPLCAVNASKLEAARELAGLVTACVLNPRWLELARRIREE